MPRCSLVVFHGGSGTLGHVIANGLPMVILPLGADQPENAQRCAELGASRTLDQANLTPENVLAWEGLGCGEHATQLPKASSGSHFLSATCL